MNTQNIKTGNIGARKNKLDKKKFAKYTVICFAFYLYMILHLLTAVERHTISGITIGFKEMFTSPFNISIKPNDGLLELFLIIYAAAILYIYFSMKKNMHDAAGIEKDSAEWNEDYEDYNIRKTFPYGSPTHEEYDIASKKMVDSFENMIMSQNVRLGMDNKITRRNGNIICFGGSGTGKTFFEIKPNLLQCHALYFFHYSHI